MAKDWFVEETMPDYSYRVIASDLDEEQALNTLYTAETGNRLEMWSRSLADSPKGFAPAAYRDKGKVYISSTFAMLAGFERGNMTERTIVHENGDYWVSSANGQCTVYRVYRVSDNTEVLPD